MIGGDERVPYIYMMDRPKNMKIADDTTLLRKLPRQDGAIAALAWSPDGRRIAVAGAAPEVNVYDPETGALVAKCKGHKAGIYTVAFSPDSTVAATAGFDGMVRLYDAATGDNEKGVRAGPAGAGIGRSEGGTMNDLHSPGNIRRPRRDRSDAGAHRVEAARRGNRTSVHPDRSRDAISPRARA